MMLAHRLAPKLPARSAPLGSRRRDLLRLAFCVILVAIALVPLVAAQNGPISMTHGSRWVQLSPRPSPPAMSDEAMTYDAAGGEILLFGGLNASSGTVFNQTWSYSGGTWTQLHSRVSPPARYDGMMSYDPKGKQVLLFGGIGPNGAFYNDTWSFSVGQWTDLAHATGGLPLASGSMSFDAQSGRLLLFGGYQDPCSCVDWPSNSTYAFEGGNWTLLHTKGANASLPGQSASFSYDPKDRYMVEFGGWNSYASGSSTWNYTHGRWTENKVANSPSWRNAPVLVFDPKQGGVIMFGGLNATGPNGPNDTWMYVGGSWLKLQPTYSPPGEQALPAGAYDNADGYLILFGGQNNSSSSPSNNTWIFR
jgi:hypothetical protein